MKDFIFYPSDTALVADITVYSEDGTSHKAYPALLYTTRKLIL